MAARVFDKNVCPARGPWFCNLSRGQDWYAAISGEKEGSISPNEPYQKSTPGIHVQKPITSKQIDLG